MKKKNIQDITISELCSKAGVSRTGFYRNFNYKEDLIYEHMKFIYSEYTNCLTSKKISLHLRLLKVSFAIFFNIKIFCRL
ncbi:TetR/AcrR family transcriptional regulator [Psychromonas sp. KJ10-2]|uniref:TetR/AcrR family transcriptional regulator n=1 Tax=Psychromonas sp. KJ10-2 TaxID=3391822 RepID=UPI0039B5B221